MLCINKLYVLFLHTFSIYVYNLVSNRFTNAVYINNLYNIFSRIVELYSTSQQCNVFFFHACIYLK
ncbi:hypothetical protein HanIR_Chr16g0822391 [Helianthus annuus]|nr:hypothetical protein HanIR_Chr16g0822391 [Helianthus annuus]